MVTLGLSQLTQVSCIGSNLNRNELLKVFVSANEFKEGDLLLGGTRDEYVRREARRVLGSLRLGEIQRAVFVEDGVSDFLARTLDQKAAAEVSELTVAELRRLLLGPGGMEWASRFSDGLTSEAVAAVVKIMTDGELSTVARTLFNSLPGPGVCIGSARHFGSRIQPNSPGDDEEEILFSILEGLSYGCGDVILGINPASDDLETIVRLEQLLSQVVERLGLPTRYSVLSDIIKQTSARQHAPVDVGFQSLAGTSKALSGMIGLDADGLLDLTRGFNGLYFETGQGSAVTNSAAEGVDMVTLEARAYGMARGIRRQTGAWMIVNDVAGFIGPEVFRTGRQLARTCLEDTVMAKLHGLTMGLDVCATFHMGIEPGELEELTRVVVQRAAPAYLMAVAGNSDPMLGYLTTSFREHPHLRSLTGRQSSTPMHQRLAELGIKAERGSLSDNAPGAEALYAVYMRAGGDRRSAEVLREEGIKTLKTLRERGYDLGYGPTADSEVKARVETIYRHARRALYAAIDQLVVNRSSPRHVSVRTRARDRDEYLSHPAAGELISDADTARLASLYPVRRPQVQIVISDGLNAEAVNENLDRILAPLRHGLVTGGHNVGEIDVVVENGRVRAGYHAGAVLGLDILIHLIGERPGTGLNTISAYLTYGRDAAGRLRWSRGLDHSCTTAICGIHPRGKPPEVAVNEIVRNVTRMVDERRSGVALPGSNSP